MNTVYIVIEYVSSFSYDDAVWYKEGEKVRAIETDQEVAKKKLNELQGSGGYNYSIRIFTVGEEPKEGGDK